MIEVEIHNEQSVLPIDAARIADAVRSVLVGEGIASGQVNVAILDAAAIHVMNRQWLEHDYPTDVLSFVIEHEGDHLEGDIAVSAQMALEMAEGFGWRPADELLLYVVHGALHIVGYDDQTDEALAAMREQEQHYLRQFDLEPSYTAREVRLS